MKWLVWRQHRWDAASSAAVLLLLGGTMLTLAGLSANLLADISRVCATTSSDCGNLRTEYQGSFGAWSTFLELGGLAVPALIGVFVGAPMVAREFELGTHLLVWAQGITRRRWFVSKLWMVVMGTLVGAAVLGAIYQYWLAPQNSITDLWYSFDVEPPVLIAYALFALMLGVAFGTLIQRTIPAMAATLVGFVVVRAVIEVFARPIYLPPLSWDVGTNLADNASFLFVGTQQHVDLAGHPISDSRWNDVVQQCSSPPVPSGKSTGTPLHDCLLNHGVLVVQQYQPDSRFWLFQGIEAAIFITFAMVLAIAAYRLVVRKS
jgi:ABC-type transport system involved in multi-copper enzyme maturation permease subunit